MIATEKTVTVPWPLLEAWMGLLRHGPYPGAGHVREAAVILRDLDVRTALEMTGATNPHALGLLPPRSLWVSGVTRVRGTYRVGLWLGSSPAPPAIPALDDWSWLGDAVSVEAGACWREVRHAG